MSVSIALILASNYNSMKHNIYLYSGIIDETAENINKQIDDISDSDTINLKINSPGGWTDAGAAIVTRISRFKGKVNMDVEGDAMSYGAMLLLWGEYNTMSDLSQLMFHKASYPFWYEPDETELKSLKQINTLFEQKLTDRIGNTQEGKDIIAKVFEADVRNDVYVMPDEAVKIGLIDEIIKTNVSTRAAAFKTITPENQMKDLDTILQSKYGKSKEGDEPTKEKTKSSNNKTNTKMDIVTLKKDHPELYSQIVTIGKAERNDEVCEILAWREADEKACMQLVLDNKTLTKSAEADFKVKMAKVLIPAKVEDEGKGTELKTKDVEPKTELQAGMPTADENAEIEAIRAKHGLTSKA